MDNADKFLWKYMIENASLGEWSHWGGYCPDNEGKRRKFNKVYSPTNIDWEKTKPVYDGTEQGFAGTFADDCDYYSVYKGTLYLKTGEKFDFITEANGLELAKIMAGYLPDPFEEKEDD